MVRQDIDRPPPALGNARRIVLVACAILVAVVMVFVIRRIFIDTANAGRTSAQIDDIDSAYSAHPALAYLHIAPGAVYLLGACLQLSRRFRTRHYAVHRRMGRVVLTSGLISGVFVFVFGARYAFGGASEAISAVVFGVWFLLCLVLAYAAIRRRNPALHRRWMIRAFGVAVGVGVIRAWVGILAGTGLTTLPTSFAIGFWLGLAGGALGAEWWVRKTPPLDG